MTSESSVAGTARALLLGAVAALAAGLGVARADTPYPFEGTWVRAERACSPSSTRVRTYIGRDVVSPRGHCVIRRVATDGRSFELLEDCRRDGRNAAVTETIRLTTPDFMVLRRQLSRLKITRPVRYARCSVAAQPAAARPPGPEVKPK